MSKDTKVAALIAEPLLAMEDQALLDKLNEGAIMKADLDAVLAGEPITVALAKKLEAAFGVPALDLLSAQEEDQHSEQAAPVEQLKAASVAPTQVTLSSPSYSNYSGTSTTLNPGPFGTSLKDGRIASSFE